MNTLTQIARFRQFVVNYSYNFSIKKAVLHFNVSRTTIYRWRKKYDGSANSLNDLSRRPHSHPNQQLYPGQRIQIDVKHVPSACIAGDARVMGDSYYQFTAIDEYSRFRYLAAFKDESSFLKLPPLLNSWLKPFLSPLNVFKQIMDLNLLIFLLLKKANLLCFN